MQRNQKIEALERAKAIASQISNPELEAFKAAGGKVVGCFDPDTPVEILESMGLMPYGMRGTGAEGTEYADAYFKQLTCEFVRTTYQQIKAGQYAFLDGAVIYNCCDHMRRIYDNYKVEKDSPCYSFIYLPKKRDELGYDFYKKEVKNFIKATEERFGVTFSKENLAKAIAESNKTRALVRELYALRKGEAVYLTGAELVDVLQAGQSIPRAKYNALLRDVIDQVKASGETFKPARRLMYAAGHACKAELVEALESQGGLVVVDDFSFGLRSAALDITMEDCALCSLLKYYYWQKPTMPRVFGTQDARIDRVMKLVEEYKVDGVVTARVTMCDLWAFEQYMLADAFNAKNIPHLDLEVNYILDGIGQIRTRVQAFVENLSKRF